MIKNIMIIAIALTNFTLTINSMDQKGKIPRKKNPLFNKYIRSSHYKPKLSIIDLSYTNQQTKYKAATHLDKPINNNLDYLDLDA